MDLTMQMLKNAKDLFKSMDSFHAITVGAYQIMNRLEDVPLTTGYTIRILRPASLLMIFSDWLIRAPSATALEPGRPHEHHCHSG